MNDEERIGRQSTRNKSVKNAGAPPAEVRRRARLVVADDDPSILDQIAGILETRFDVVGRACNGLELVDAVRTFSPDVVVSDITMPELNGIRAARLITETYPGVKVVMLSVHDDPAFIEAAFEAGASGYVLKLGVFEELLAAIDGVLAGGTYRPGNLCRSPRKDTSDT